MKKAISFIRHSHPEVYKGVLFFIAITTIVYILPKQGKFQYEFQNLKGKPWNHENLVAPFEGASVEVKTFGSGNKYKITTSYLIDDN